MTMALTDIATIVVVIINIIRGGLCSVMEEETPLSNPT